MEEFLLRLLYSSLGIAAGVIMTVKANQIVDSVGRISWAEKYFGSAGTYGFVRLLGMFFIFFFLAYLTGILGKVYLSIVGFLVSIFGVAG